MAATQSRCQGCGGIFTRHGLAQHVVKTQRPLCRAADVALEPLMTVRNFRNVGQPLASPAFSDPSEDARWSSSGITGADEGNYNYYMLSCASLLTNKNISDYTMNDGNDGLEAASFEATDSVHDAADFADDLDPAAFQEFTDDVLDTDDVVDGLDADVFDDVTDGVTVASMAIPEGVLPIELAASIQPPPDPVIQNEDADLEANSEPLANSTVTDFPFGSPGAPIPGADQGSESAVHQSSQAALSSSVWSPFSSRLDWEIARWAKIRGPTSSALTELLAIPEVRDLCLASIDNLLTYYIRSSRDLVSHIRQQTS
jgi:hypothetical protein